jgi:hypothetical protein
LSRGERWAAAAIALGLGGCMRIYPDPELPDVRVEWDAEFECADATDRVVVSLSTVEPPAEVGMATVPCGDAGVRFDDVARVRYRLAARLEDATGAVFGGHDEDLDLRDGLNERVFAFFGRSFGTSFRVAWTFDMGASCQALSATQVFLQASMPGGGPAFFFFAPCDAPVYVNAIPLEGTYTLTARAIADNGVVAAAPESAPFTITPGAAIDLGTLTLSPCGAACPPLGL